jgi:hypothetical protein
MGVLLRDDDVAVRDRNAEGVDVVDVVTQPVLWGFRCAAVFRVTATSVLGIALTALRHQAW